MENDFKDKIIEIIYKITNIRVDDCDKNLFTYDIDSNIMVYVFLDIEKTFDFHDIASLIEYPITINGIISGLLN